MGNIKLILFFIINILIIIIIIIININIMSTTCTICFESTGHTNKRTLSCGHSFHFKCLKRWEETLNLKNKNTDICLNLYHCPYCRTKYSNIVLRERKLNTYEIEVRRLYISNFRRYVNDVYGESCPKNKINKLGDMYAFILKKNNLTILLNYKFKLHSIINILLEKIALLKTDVLNVLTKGGIDEATYISFCKKSDLILKKIK